MPVLSRYFTRSKGCKKNIPPPDKPVFRDGPKRGIFLLARNTMEIPGKPMTDCLLVYITVPDREEAETVCRTLVRERLAACANISGAIDSIYWWQGEMESAGEVLCVLKTTRTRFPELALRARELHSYDTPCIVALPLEAGDDAYFDWIRNETRSGA